MTEEKGKSDSSEKKKHIYKKLSEQRKEAKTIRRIVAITVLAIGTLAAVLLIGAYAYVNSALKPVDPDSKKTVNVEIPIGSTVNGIGQILEDKGIIRDARVFKYYVKFKNESGFMAGKYSMKPSMTLSEVVTGLKSGKVMQKETIRITIPEGKQLSQIADIMADKTSGNAEEMLKVLNDEKFIKSMMEKYPDLLSQEILDKDVKYPLEGYLYPATYPFYTEKPTVEEMVMEMLAKTDKVLKNYREQAEAGKMSTHNLLTMASLIEEEATEKADRKKISSVFYNRIAKDMPLQTDPTVLYAHGKHKKRVFYKDLEIDSPYNTYKYKGLPPGPIANSGVMSIEAALEPDNTDYLYFLATPAGDVIYTRTLDEHNTEKARHITGNNQ
ncbi:endolytic transglycosylase MltG [Bacillus massilinigeriensis]|uniref:endolytic transglycosylase MltG n=1 Tax=Bacillus mediterraneensis TaxID=1805474 RepID=UPI0008F915AD|nr:endolytic transglycosylase MltG [Bacillus mediterraneensis]